MALWSGFNFQNMMGGVSSLLESLHDLIMVWLAVILLLVSLIACLVIINSLSAMGIGPDSEMLEKTWTLLPMAVLVSIAIPSIRLLCMQDSMCQVPNYTVKVISNQWNWLSDTVDSYDHLLDADLLDTSSSFEIPVVLSGSTMTRVLVTSSDVLHSLGIPSLGVKLDSAPGRLNATTVEVFSPGVFVGSCFELCGSGHSMMPINTLVL